MTGSDGTDGETERCSFCRMPIPTEPVAAGETGDCCSEACRDALLEGDDVFTEHQGNQRVQPGVSALDASLPQGFPRNAFVLVSDEPGARDRAVGAELVWRALERGEPAVVVSFKEPPGSVVQQFVSLDWNVLPYLESGQLHVIDCFTYRVEDRERMFDRMDDWSRHLHRVAADATTTIRDPTDLGEVQNKLDNALERREMVDDGLVIMDSLTELGTLVQPVQAYNFVKEVRADVCKGRFVPVFAGATRAGTGDAFPHDLSYVADGLIDLRLTDEIVDDTLIKQIRIRKLNGVLVIPEWHTYEYTSRLGMVLFDPEEELEVSTDAGEAGSADHGERSAAGDPSTAAPDETRTGDASGDEAGGAGGADGGAAASGPDEEG